MTRHHNRGNAPESNKHMAKITAKSGSTRVATAKLVKTAEQVGLTMKGRAGWILMFLEGTPSKRLLVHTGKKGTNCIELVGFEAPHTIPHPCPPAKTMTQMIDCNVSEKEILRAFYKVARILNPVKVASEPTTAPVEAPVEA
jgi:hypothetical protein